MTCTLSGSTTALKGWALRSQVLQDHPCQQRETTESQTMLPADGGPCLGSPHRRGRGRPWPDRRHWGRLRQRTKYPVSDTSPGISCSPSRQPNHPLALESPECRHLAPLGPGFRRAGFELPPRIPAPPTLGRELPFWCSGLLNGKVLQQVSFTQTLSTQTIPVTEAKSYSDALPHSPAGITVCYTPAPKLRSSALETCMLRTVLPSVIMDE